MKATYEEGQRICQGYVCVFDHNHLVLAWESKQNSHIVRCPKCLNEEEFTPKSAAIKAEKADEQRLLKEDAAKAEARTGVVSTQPPNLLLASQDIGTQKEITPIQADMLLIWARWYGLDAYLGHVVMMYGKPYVGIDGLIYIARQRDPQMRMITTIATPEEKEAYGLGDGDFLFTAMVLAHDGSPLANGIGIVTTEEQGEMSKKDPTEHRYPIVANKPAEMAEKRALYDALRRAFPLERVSNG